MLDKRLRAGRGGRRIAEWLPNYGRAGSLGDRDTEAHERSLIEIDAKYAYVISLDRALTYLAERPSSSGSDASAPG